MNKKGLGETGWLIILLLVFAVINWVSLSVNGFKLEAVSTWIVMILGSLIEVGVAYILKKNL